MYTASLDKLAKIITICITVLFLTIIVWQVYTILNNHTYAGIFIIVLLLFIYFGTFALRPINYELTSDSIVIHRLLSDIKTDYKNIVGAEKLTDEMLEGAIRTFGVGGLFGYFGKFANTQLGSMNWYATQTDKAVLIKTIDPKKIIITPDDPDRFLKELKLHLYKI